MIQAAELGFSFKKANIAALLETSIENRVFKEKIL